MLGRCLSEWGIGEVLERMWRESRGIKKCEEDSIEGNSREGNAGAE